MNFNEALSKQQQAEIDFLNSKSSNFKIAYLRFDPKTGHGYELKKDTCLMLDVLKCKHGTKT